MIFITTWSLQNLWIYFLLLTDISIGTRYKVGCMGISYTRLFKYAQCFKSHYLFSTAFTFAAYGVGCDFARVLVVVFHSIPVRNCPDACDSPHVTNLVSDVVPSCYACQYFIWGLAQNLAICHGSYSNFNKLLWIMGKLTFTENETYAVKIWSYMLNTLFEVLLDMNANKLICLCGC